MRIPSGVTDQVIYFVAVDATDLKTRETGLSSFTVYRSRNGGAAAAYTTPTVTEVDVTNMPGVYKLLLDEDMTIASGNDSEEVCLHITQASMAPVTRVFELYRRTATAGTTITVESDGHAHADLKEWLGSAPASLADTDKVPVSVQHWSLASITTNITGTLSGSVGSISGVTFPTNFADLSITVTTGRVDVATIEGTDATDQINAACDTALTDYDAPTKTEMDSAFTEIKGATWASSTDTLEAIRDRGDAAWITATGFSTHTANNVRDAVTGGAYALDTDANGRVRVVSGTAAGELSLASGVIAANMTQIAGSGSVDGVTVSQWAFLVGAAVAGDTQSGGTVFKAIGDNTTTRITTSIDGSSNRTNTLSLT